MTTSTTQLKFVHTGNSITIMLAGRPYSIAKTDSIFGEVVDLIKSGSTEDSILSVINRAVAAVQAASQITPNISIANGVVLFKGQSVNNGLTERMLTMLDEGFDLTPMALFLENLMSNPSYRAVQELYSFLEKGSMPITPDGYFMAYKAVRADFKDIHSGTFDNSIGQVCEMPRNAVDDDKNRTCSAGLHFCSFEYLPHFANANGHVMLVKINPRDVVSIPADYNDTKGRCARYEVVGEHEGYYTEHKPFFTSSVYDPSNGDQSGDDFEDTDFESDEYSVYGDGEHLESFDTIEEAIAFANDSVDEYTTLNIEDEDGDVVETIVGNVEIFTVFVDGVEGVGYNDLNDARRAAVAAFVDGVDSVTVEDRDGNVAVELNHA